MKTIKNIGLFVLGLAWIFLLLLAIINSLQIAWKMVFIFIWLGITWIGYELKNAKEMPEDYNPPRR